MNFLFIKTTMRQKFIIHIIWLLFTDAITLHFSFSMEGDCNSSAGKKYKVSKRLFPYDQPELHLPWWFGSNRLVDMYVLCRVYYFSRVWDVVADPIRRYAEFIAVSRSACFFDQKAWYRVLELFPQYKKQLGDGGAKSSLR